MDNKALNGWFANLHSILETAYISHTEPWRQSGMSGPLERWVSLRKPVADCIDRSGSFLDIGCANGYLLEWILQWTAERGMVVDPYGVDVSQKLVEMAAQRLPGYSEHFFVGNAFYWVPPVRFDFVRTELVYVPGDYECQYLHHLAANYLKPGGKLLVANYLEGIEEPGKKLLPENYPTRYILERLADLGFKAAGYRDGYDPLKNRRVRIVILSG